MNKTRYEELAEYMRAEDIEHFESANRDGDFCPCRFCDVARAHIAAGLLEDLANG